MGKRELQIKGNGGKLGLSGEKCVHMNCLMFQRKNDSLVNLPFNPLNLRTESCLPVRVWGENHSLGAGWGLASACPILSEMGCGDLDVALVFNRSLRSML